MNKEFIKILKKTFETDNSNYKNTAKLLDKYYEEGNSNNDKIYCGWNTIYNYITCEYGIDTKECGYALRDLIKDVDLNGNIVQLNKKDFTLRNVEINEFRIYLYTLEMLNRYQEKNYEIVAEILDTLGVDDIVGWRFIHSLEILDHDELKNLFKNVKNTNCELFYYDKNKKELRNATDEEINERIYTLVAKLSD